MNLDFSNIKVLLIGDFMVDHYIIGTSNRMSPEAPVPVVIPEKTYFAAGGAGNVAMNLSTMGANVDCIGWVGTDQTGLELTEILKQNNINTDGMTARVYEARFGDDIQHSGSDTIVKQRIYSNGTQIVRIDWWEQILEDWHPHLPSEFEYDRYDIIILSDYNKGVLNNKWFTKIDSDNIIVDPKKDDFSYYSNGNIITPNLNELQRASKIEIKDNKSIVDACNKLIEECNFNYIVVKKGDQGMTIIGKDNFVKHIAAHPVENPDVTGAGDTFVAALSLAFAKTEDIEISAKIANAAAAVVVGKTGTATVTIDEINNYISIDE